MGPDVDALVQGRVLCERTRSIDPVPDELEGNTMKGPVALMMTAAVLAWAQITPERIRSADREPGNWLTYSRTYNGQRYSPLAEVTTSNVGRLQAAWTYLFFNAAATSATQTLSFRVAHPTWLASALRARAPGS